MLDIVLALAELAAFVAIAAALVRPSLRRRVAWSLLGAAGLALCAGIVSGGARRLAVEAGFARFRDNQIEFGAFPIETVDAPGFAFGLVVLAFCGAWAMALFVLDRRSWPPGELIPATGAGAWPFMAPLLLAWSGTALVLLLEKAAGPAGLVRPLAFERAILPASIAAAALLAIRLRSVISALLWVCLFVSVARWPIAAFGALATHFELGTSLDVHTITEFANPFAQMPVSVAPHSTEQIVWLNLGPNLLLLPGLYLFSAGGIAFAVAMFVLHPPEARSHDTSVQSGTPGTR
ncbi:MAG: hypothetical protein HZB39_03740 [Planctomycetes bacterium]|nr:hypothetical protein [Planctomycetota bacterium]